MKSIVTVALASLVAGTAHADPADPWDGGTVKSYMKGEAVGLLAGGAVGMVTGIAIGAKSGGGEPGDIIVGMGIGMGAGVVLGMPIGGQIAADRHGGGGAWWGSALGSIGAVGALTGLSYLLYRTHREPDNGRIDATVAVGMIVVFGVLFAGPLVGYELTSNAPVMRF